MEEQLREKTDQVDKLIGELQETQQTASRLRKINDGLQRSLSQQQNKISEDSMHLTELREKKELVVAERQLLLDQIEATSRERDHFRDLSDTLVIMKHRWCCSLVCTARYLVVTAFSMRVRCDRLSSSMMLNEHQR